MLDEGLTEPGGVRIVRLPAVIDVTNAMNVREELNAFLGHGVAVLIADLTATATLTLEGLQVLLLTRARAQRDSTHLRLAAPGFAVRRYMEVTGTARLFDLYGTVEQAREGTRHRASNQ
ncbi:MAG: STAS domain-containing protein [Streptosporangiaceae bacterium]